MNKKSKTLLILSLVMIPLLVGVTIAAADFQGSINGGGQIRQFHENGNGSELYKISFGGWVQGQRNPTGEWEVNFHNVGVDKFDKTKFHTTDFKVVNYFPGNNPSCHSAFNFTAFGKWKNKPGYTMIFRGGDFGSPGKEDTVRIELWNPGGTKVYDTDWSDEFASESNCVGTARTGLDKGNLTVVQP